jgi:hypothetical protein
MRLSAAIALKADYPAEVLVARLHDLLREVDPDVGIDVRSIGSEFGIQYKPPSILDVLAEAERLRGDLLRRYWREREQRWLTSALRLGNAMASMEIGRICRRMDDIEAMTRG